MQGERHTLIGCEADVRPVRCKDQGIHHPQGQTQSYRRGVRVAVIRRCHRRQRCRRYLRRQQTNAPVRADSQITIGRLKRVGIGAIAAAAIHLSH